MGASTVPIVIALVAATLAVVILVARGRLPSTQRRYTPLRLLTKLDSRVLPMFERISPIRRVVLTAITVVATGLAVGFAFGHPVPFLIGMMAYSAFPLFWIGMNERRRARSAARRSTSREEASEN